MVTVKRASLPMLAASMLDRSRLQVELSVGSLQTKTSTFPLPFDTAHATGNALPKNFCCVEGFVTAKEVSGPI